MNTTTEVKKSIKNHIKAAMGSIQILAYDEHEKGMSTKEYKTWHKKLQDILKKLN